MKRFSTVPRRRAFEPSQRPEPVPFKDIEVLGLLGLFLVMGYTAFVMMIHGVTAISPSPEHIVLASPLVTPSTAPPLSE